MLAGAGASRRALPRIVERGPSDASPSAGRPRAVPGGHVPGSRQRRQRRQRTTGTAHGRARECRGAWRPGGRGEAADRVGEGPPSPTTLAGREAPRALGARWTVLTKMNNCPPRTAKPAAAARHPAPPNAATMATTPPLARPAKTAADSNQWRKLRHRVQASKQIKETPDRVGAEAAPRAAPPARCGCAERRTASAERLTAVRCDVRRSSAPPHPAPLGLDTQATQADSNKTPCSQPSSKSRRV